MRGFNLHSAAAFTFAINSLAISAMCAEASLGLVTKSNAPSPSAFMVTLAPSVLCELNTITGTGWRRMISFKVSMPFMPGISRSSVTTLGLSSSIFFRQKVPSMAVPTTSIDSSTASICGISLRISAESSTTSTRTACFFAFRFEFGIMLGLPVRSGSGPAACDRSRSATIPNSTCPLLPDAGAQRARRPRAG